MMEREPSQHRVLVAGVDPVVEIRSRIGTREQFLLLSDELGKPCVELFFLLT